MPWRAAPLDDGGRPAAGIHHDRRMAGTARLTARETRGKDLFFGERAECFHCHTSFNLNDQTVHAGTGVVETPFHNTGLVNVGGTGTFRAPTPACSS